MNARALVACMLVLVVSSASTSASTRRSTATSPEAQTQRPTLPIRRVTIYNNGVAYIERRGTVTGHAEIALPFKQSQIDDALKSMVVLDLGKGAIGAVSYASTEPPAVRLGRS